MRRHAAGLFGGMIPISFPKLFSTSSPIRFTFTARNLNRIAD